MPRSAPASASFAWLINRLIYCCYKYGSEEFEMFIPFSCTIWCDRLIPDMWCCDSHRHISFLSLTYIHLILGQAILNTWYLTPVLAMLYLTLDIWHRYLSCYTWPLISDTGTCHAIFDTWYPTPVLVMLYLTLDIRHRYLTCYHSPDMLSHTWHAII